MREFDSSGRKLRIGEGDFDPQARTLDGGCTSGDAHQLIDLCAWPVMEVATWKCSLLALGTGRIGCVRHAMLGSLA